MPEKGGVQRAAFAETLPTDPAIAPFVRDQALTAGVRVGEYVVEHQLGAGAFGTVYRGTHPVIGKAAAIKVLNLRYSVDPGIVARFIDEARAVNKIGHSGIIDIFGFGRLDDGRQYYVMELLEGMTLLELLEKRGRLPLAEVVEILEPIGRALDAAHAAGIAHRDLKPANIFLARNEGFRSDGSRSEGEGRWRPKLLDFGVAKLMGDAEGGAHRTETGATVGTPAYMSPEQCLGKNVDHRTDIYSFGVVAFQMLTGRLPFDADSAFSLMAAHINDPAPTVSQIAEVPRSVDRVLAWLLAKNPDERPKTLAEAMAAFAAAARGADVGGGRQAPPKKRGPALIAAVGAVAAAGVAAFFLLRPAEEAASAPSAAAPPTVAPSPPVTAPPPPPSVVAAPPPLPATVAVEVKQIPDDARVLGADGLELRRGPGRVSIARGASPMKLAFEAPGRRPHAVEIVPDRDQTLVVELEALPRPASAPAPKPSAGAPSSKSRGEHDLEPW